MSDSLENIGALVRDVRDSLRQGAIETPERDARLLAEAALGLDGLGLLRNAETAAGATPRRALNAMTARRLKGEPVARILGEKGFYGLDFALSPATLVPRPETEMLVEHAIDLLRGQRNARLLDLGTGSGCIAISILANLPGATGVAVDLSGEALQTAHFNALRHGVADRLDLRRGSWFSPLSQEERFELVVSNPPYIKSGQIPLLGPEVRLYDPLLALDGGPDGLAAYREIAGPAWDRLSPRGALLLEIGSTQGPAVAELLSQAGWTDIAVEKDLAGLDRMVRAHHV